MICRTVHRHDALLLFAQHRLTTPLADGLTGCTNVVQGKTADIESKMKRDWKEAVIANWKLWIPFQFLNFRFIPQNLQVRDCLPTASNVTVLAHSCSRSRTDVSCPTVLQRLGFSNVVRPMSREILHSRETLLSWETRANA